MAQPRVVLILGSGPRVGTAVSEQFARDGYKVAIVSRKGSNSVDAKGYLSLQADFADADPQRMTALFDAVEAEFHAAPSVVVYNAASLTPPADPASVLSIPEARIRNDLQINVVAPMVAAQESIKRWDASSTPGKKLFIYTGNMMNVSVIPVPLMLNLGVGKAASAYWVGLADGAFASKGYRFIYADQRQEGGKFSGPALDGPAHGEFYSQLAANNGESVPWLATFIKGQGYVKC